jgi:type III pantothenate kinase
VLRYVADLGNTRVKWAHCRSDGGLEPSLAFGLSNGDEWIEALRTAADASTEWAISSVNPPVAERFAAVLSERGVTSARWFRSAADAPVPHELDAPEQAGADRALAVLATQRRLRAGAAGSGLVISCGTAITVERISGAGVWQGGAIALGLGISAQALEQFTAQLPLIEIQDPPPVWGRSTIPALQAGVFWGTVGAVRELIARQRAAGLADASIIWTGGDAPVLAEYVEGPRPVIVPDLVLEGLALAAFAGRPPA